MAEVIWTIKAVEQVEQIGAFIEKDSPFQARRVVQLIIKEARRLREHARVGKMIPEMEDVRNASYGSSVIEFCTRSWPRNGLQLSESSTDSDCSIRNGSNDHKDSRPATAFLSFEFRALDLLTFPAKQGRASIFGFRISAPWGMAI